MKVQHNINKQILGALGVCIISCIPMCGIVNKLFAINVAIFNSTHTHTHTHRERERERERENLMHLGCKRRGGGVSSTLGDGK